jgi:hypothetical protein
MASWRSALKSHSIGLTALFIGFVTIAVFLPAIHNGFVNWDDDVNLVNNPNFRGFSWNHLIWMWTNHLGSHYIPITWMSFGLDYVLWKEKPGGYHLTSVLLHAANTAVFFLLALGILKRSFSGIGSRGQGALLWGAAFAALFFGLHPLRVESVAWATERRDVLSGLFYLLAVLVYVRAFQAQPNRCMPLKPYLTCLALFVMSILSKEIAVTLPFILLILDVYPLRRLPGPSGWMAREVRTVWLEKIPFFAIALADGIITLAFGIRNHLLEPVAGLGWIPRIASTVYSMAFYILKTIAPISLSPLYPLTRYKTHLSGMPFQLSAATVLLVTLTCIVLRRRFPGVLLAWIACAVTLIPVSGIIQAGFQIAADRYTYLACLGCALLAGAGVSLGWRAVDHSRIGKVMLASAAVPVLLTLSILTMKQLAIWRDSRTLWTRAIAVEPFFATHLNLAGALFNEGDTLGAVDQYRRAIGLWPDNAAIHCMLGGALLDLRQGGEAAREFRLAIQFGPSSDAYVGLTHALVMQGKLDEAIGVLREALLRDPGNVRYQSSLEQAARLRTERGAEAGQVNPSEQR